MQNESDPPPSRPSAFNSGRLHCTLACTAPSALLAPTRAMPKVFGESDVQLLLQCLRKHVACCIPQSVPPFAFGSYTHAKRLDQPLIMGLIEIKALLLAVLSAVPAGIVKQIALRDAAKLLLVDYPLLLPPKYSVGTWSCYVAAQVRTGLAHVRRLKQQPALLAKRRRAEGRKGEPVGAAEMAELQALFDAYQGSLEDEEDCGAPPIPASWGGVAEPAAAAAGGGTARLSTSSSDEPSAKRSKLALPAAEAAARPAIAAPGPAAALPVAVRGAFAPEPVAMALPVSGLQASGAAAPEPVAVTLPVPGDDGGSATAAEPFPGSDAGKGISQAVPAPSGASSTAAVVPAGPVRPAFTPSMVGLLLRRTLMALRPTGCGAQKRMVLDARAAKAQAHTEQAAERTAAKTRAAEQAAAKGEAKGKGTAKITPKAKGTAKAKAKAKGQASPPDSQGKGAVTGGSAPADALQSQGKKYKLMPYLQADRVAVRECGGRQICQIQVVGADLADLKAAAELARQALLAGQALQDVKAGRAYTGSLAQLSKALPPVARADTIAIWATSAISLS